MFSTLTGAVSTCLRLDVRWTRALAVCTDDRSSMARLRPLAKALELSCHGVPWFLYAGLGYISTDLNSASNIFFQHLFIAFCVDVLLVGGLKLLSRRPRPAHNVHDMPASGYIDSYAFPSGHCSRVTLLTMVYWSRVSPVWLRLPLTVWWFSVSVSRVILGRHHITDVVCGVSLGLLHYYYVIVTGYTDYIAGEVFSWTPLLHNVLHNALHSAVGRWY